MGDETPIEAMARVCHEWTQATVTKLKAQAPRDKGALSKSIKGTVLDRRGKQEPYAISFKYERYGAWIERGAGKGAGGPKGSTWKNKDKVIMRRNPKSASKMGIVRKPHPWFEPVMRDDLPILSELIAQHVASAIIKYVSSWRGSTATEDIKVST